MKNIYLAKKLCVLSLILTSAFSYGMEQIKSKMHMGVSKTYKEDCPLVKEEYYKKGQRFGTNYCNLLANISLCVKNSPAWMTQWHEEISARFNVQGTLYNSFQDGLANSETLFNCWNAFQRGMFDALQSFKVDICFATKVLSSVDLKTKDIEELKTIGSLHQQMEYFYSSWVKTTQENLVPQTMNEVIKLEDSRCLCAPERD